MDKTNPREKHIPHHQFSFRNQCSILVSNKYTGYSNKSMKIYRSFPGHKPDILRWYGIWDYVTNLKSIFSGSARDWH